MKKGKKIVRRLVIVILVVVIAVVLIFNFASNSIIKTAIEKGGSSAMSVAVTVGSVDMSLGKVSFAIKDMKIANPEGYKTDYMLELGNMSIDTSYGGVFGDPIIIDEIVLENISVTLEQKGLSNNIQDILNNINKNFPPSDKPAPEPTEQKKGKDLIIKRLLITGTSVSAKLLPLGGKENVVKFEIAPIEMENLGENKPMDAAKLSAKIIAAIVQGIVQQGGGLLPKELTGAMGDSIGGAVELLKLKQSSDELLKGTKDIGEGLKEGLGGLFKPKDKK